MKGIKRHVVVDKNGFLIGVMVTVANIHDSKATYFLMHVLKELCSGLKVIWLTEHIEVNGLNV